jgi:hypothetical protein
MLISEYVAGAVPGIPLSIDIKLLPAGTYTVVFTNTSSRGSCLGRFVVIK